MEKKDVPILSTGMPSTLLNWYDLCAAFMGVESSPAKFLKEKMDKHGPDEPVIANEGQLLMVLGRMLGEDLDAKRDLDRLMDFQ